jgi:hypothetical protein
MKKSMIAASIFATTMLVGGAAIAQNSGAAAGAATGAVGGAVVGGPVGAAVGGVAGAVAGGIADQDRARFREYVVREKRPSVTVKEDVRIGAELPSTVTYYEVPSEYKVTKYRYAVVNNKTVLVDPGNRKVVEVID